eukprot:GHVL01014427.1.p1 GENE.GHVL01014427.1~~GHVL01014427.1.p1  ORF type:complete len:113 (+),score=15.23 GHVL01014427.1:87-425(+)
MTMFIQNLIYLERQIGGNVWRTMSMEYTRPFHNDEYAVKTKATLEGVKRGDAVTIDTERWDHRTMYQIYMEALKKMRPESESTAEEVNLLRTLQNIFVSDPALGIHTQIRNE